MSRVAIMQPYLFPYPGYYQLAAHVDTFVFLDDVNYIKGGYINRNSYRGRDGEAVRFTLPVSSVSSFRPINEHLFANDDRHADKLLKGLAQAYGSAAFAPEIMPLVEGVIRQTDRNVARLAARSVTACLDYLGVARPFRFASEIAPPGALRGQDRVIDLCHRLGATEYINSIGGVDLYSRDAFAAAGLQLRFLRMDAARLVHDGRNHAPFSIIDAMMHCPRDVLLDLLSRYELV